MSSAAVVIGALRVKSDSVRAMKLLGCKKLSKRCASESKLCHLMPKSSETATLTIREYFFESGKDMAVKGKGWVLPYICCAQDTRYGGPLTSTAPTAIGYGKPDPCNYASFTIFIRL